MPVKGKRKHLSSLVAFLLAMELGGQAQAFTTSLETYPARVTHHAMKTHLAMATLQRHQMIL